MSPRLAPFLAAGLVVAIAGCSGSVSKHPSSGGPPPPAVLPPAGLHTASVQTGSLDAAAAPVPLGRTITATAAGNADGAPDLLTVSLGVQTHARTAQAALGDNAGKAQSLIAKLKSDGVVDNDIQTSQLNVNPDYSGGGPGVQPTITGYSVTNLVNAKLRKLDKAGTLIDDAVASAGNDARVNSIGYSIDDNSALLAAARADAVRQAQARAKAMAQAAGVSLGPVRAITDVSPVQMQPFYGVSAGVAGGAAGGVGAPTTPFQPGTQRLTVEVVVIFDIA